MEIKIDVEGLNLSCGCDSSEYPFGKVWFNTEFYKIECVVTGITIYLNRDSKYGLELKDILEYKEGVSSIDNLALKIVFEKETNANIINYINNRIKIQIEIAYNKGRQDFKSDIKKLLF